MNYLKPRQRQSDQRWDYTQMNDGRIHPIGYCAGFREYTHEQRNAFLMSDKWYEEYVSRKAEYHEDGHATPEEAAACYKRYELDTSLRFGESSSTKHKCEVCEEWTTKHAMVGGYTHITLCDAHATSEEVEKLYSVGESWES